MRATFTSAVAKDKRQYTCPSCGYSAEVEIVTIGEGAQSSLNPAGTAESRAMKDAHQELDRVYSIATCPKCNFRDSGAVRRWWFRQLVPFALLIGGIAILGWLPMFIDMNMRESDKSIAGWVVTGIAAFCAIPYFFHIWMKWRSSSSGVHFPPQEPTGTG